MMCWNTPKVIIQRKKACTNAWVIAGIIALLTSVTLADWQEEYATIGQVDVKRMTGGRVATLTAYIPVAIIKRNFLSWLV